MLRVTRYSPGWRIRWLAALAALVTVSGLAACTSSSGSAADAAAGVDTKTHTITIGGSAPLTGEYAVYKANIQGAEAYVAYVDAHGGINGWKINYKVLDDQYQPAVAVSNAQRLVTQDKVFALAVFAGTPTSLAALPYAVSQKIPYVGLTAETGVLTGKYTTATDVFGFVPPYAEVGAFEVKYLSQNLHYPKVAFAYEDDTVGQAHEAGAQYEAKQLGVGLVSVPISNAATDFTGYCAKMKASGARVVQYVLGPPQAIGLVKTCHSIGYNPQYMGAFYDPSPSLFSSMGGLAKNMLFESWLEPVTDNTPGMKIFAAAMGKYENLSDPTILSELGWMGMGIFLHGLQTATAGGHALTVSSFENALNNGQSFDPGSLGATVTYSKSNRLTHGQDRVLRWNGTTLVTVSGPTPDPILPVSLLH